MHFVKLVSPCYKSRVGGRSGVSWWCARQTNPSNWKIKKKYYELQEWQSERVMKTPNELLKWLFISTKPKGVCRWWIFAPFESKQCFATSFGRTKTWMKNGRELDRTNTRVYISIPIRTVSKTKLHIINFRIIARSCTDWLNARVACEQHT